MGKSKKEIVLIVLNYNDYKNTSNYINRVIDYKRINQIVVVDNCSNDDSYERLLYYKNPSIDVIRTESNNGYASGNNFGIKYAIKKYSVTAIVISNPDVLFEENVLINMMNILNTNKMIGQIAPVMSSPNGRPENIAWRLPTFYDNLLELLIPWKRINSGKYLEQCEVYKNNTKKVDVLSGAFFMIKKNVFEDVGFFDESTFLYGEENILAYKLKKKEYQNILVIDDIYLHEQEGSINKSISSQRVKSKHLYDAVKIYNSKYLKKGFFWNIIFEIVWQISKFTRIILFFKKKIVNSRNNLNMN